MTHNCRQIFKSDGCCRRDKNMIKCATTAINQMKTMFDTAWCPIKQKPDKRRGKYNGCVIDPVCNIRECPFRGTGVAPNVLETYCTKSKDRTGSGVADRDAMRLMPGDVGLRGDRATFSLVRDDGLAHYEHTTGNGAVYYNMRPSGNQAVVEQDDEPDGDHQQMYEQEQELDQDQEPDADRNMDQDQDQMDADQEYDQDQDQQVDESGDQAKERKHVMEMLPASVKPALGPVTGLPVGDDEHVFVLWLGKRPGEPDEKARLQIEVRVPKRMPEPEAAPPEPEVVEVLPEVKGGKKKKKRRGSSKKSNSSKKSGGSKKSSSSKKSGSSKKGRKK